MKKIFALLVVISGALFSCESDDEANYKTPDYVSGTWEFKQVGTINFQNNLLYEEYVNDTGCTNDNLQLNADGTFSWSDFFLLENNCDSDIINGTFEIVNKDLILTYQEEDEAFEIVFTIIELTYDTMTIAGADAFGDTVFYKLER